MDCRHCQRHPITRPRGLCWRCFYCPEVRARYPPIKREGRGFGRSRGRRPCEPTTAEPGTPEKIAVLTARAARGEELFHEDDPYLFPHVLAEAA